MKIGCLLLFLLFSFCANGQKMSEDYFEQGLIAYVNKDYKKSIEENSYLLQHYPKFWNNRAVNANLARAYSKARYFDSATTIFRALLADTAIENTRNKKHETGLELAETYKTWGKYDSALKYLCLSDTLNYYSNGCGNCIEDEMCRMTRRLIDLSELMGDTASEEKQLLKLALFQPTFSPKLLNKLRDILTKDKYISLLKKKDAIQSNTIFFIIAYIFISFVLIMCKLMS